MDQAKPAVRLSDQVEQTLIADVLRGRYPVGGNLPLERDLAAELGVGRPTLREAIGRLARDGWFSVGKGRPTRVNDYWRTGNLNIIAAMARMPDFAPLRFIDYLLELRVALAPSYVKSAVAHNAALVVAALVGYQGLDDDPAAWAGFDWGVQQELARIAPNPLYTLLLNSFEQAYLPAASVYFAKPANRVNSRRFYASLLEAAMAGNADLAGEVTLEAMNTAAKGWREQAAGGNEGSPS